MPNIDWQKLKQDAAETFNDIDTENLTRNSFTILGACVAILEHEEDTSELYVSMNENTANDPTGPVLIDYVPNSKIDELIQEKLKHFVEYSRQKGLAQTTGAALHGQYAGESLKKMLKFDEEIAKLMYNSADKKEQELIKESQKKILRDM